MFAFIEGDVSDYWTIDVLLLICRAVLQCPIPVRAEITIPFQNFTAKVSDRLVSLIEHDQVKASFGREAYVTSCLKCLLSLNDDSPGFAGSIIAAVQEIHRRIGVEQAQGRR